MQKILIVEDDPSTRAGLGALLAGAGYQAIAMDNVPSAMQRLAEDPPDLLLVDIRVQGFNGLQLVAMRPRQVPAIVMSGYSDPILEQDARSLGADFLHKPISPPALLELVAERLHEVERVSDFAPTRRWARKSPRAEVLSRLENAQARIVDISYGGVCLELKDSAPVGTDLRLTIPAEDVSLRVKVVWKRSSDDATSICGAAVNVQDQPAWWGVVDALV